jgi:hypothetical protein
MNGTRKALPPRPSEDRGYGGSPSLNGAAQLGGQNGYERPGTSNGSVRKPSVQGPNGAVILDGYRSEIMNGFEAKPRFNPVSIALLPNKRGALRTTTHGSLPYVPP